MKFIRRFSKHLVVASLLAILLFIPYHDQHASCLTPAEQGNWVNMDPTTRSLPRIKIRFVCQDQILNGQPYPPGAPYYVHLFGKCHPSDCDWGEAPATRLESGQIYAVYDQGFAKRYVYAKMSTVRPGKLWVYVFTNFKSPKRKDYAVTNYYSRELVSL